MHREDGDDRGREPRPRPAGDGAVQPRALRRGARGARAGAAHRRRIRVPLPRGGGRSATCAPIVIQQGELAHGRRLIARGPRAWPSSSTTSRASAPRTRSSVRSSAGSATSTAAERTSLPPVDLATSPPDGFDVVTSDSLLGLALVASGQGRHDEALAHVDEAIARGRRGDSPMAVARALVGRGYVQLARGPARRGGGGVARRAGDGGNGWGSPTSSSRPRPRSPRSRCAAASERRRTGSPGRCWRRSASRTSSGPSSPATSTGRAGGCCSSAAILGPPTAPTAARAYLDTSARGSTTTSCARRS